MRSYSFVCIFMFLGRCLAFARQLRVFQVSVCFVLGLGIFFSVLYSVVFK